MPPLESRPYFVFETKRNETKRNETKRNATQARVPPRRQEFTLGFT